MVKSNRLSRISRASYDVLIIGAGINGCAAARQLTADGFRVLLVDRGDFGGIATAQSGRVLHCGLQLLQPRRSIMEFVRSPRELAMRLRMVRRTALDFIELCDVLPLQLKPMQTVVPVYQDDAFCGWQVDLGAFLIKLIARFSPKIRYRRLAVKDAVADPFVQALADRHKLKGVVSFRDYRFHWPERIAIDAALAAEQGGAAISNFTEVVSLHCTGNGKWTAELLDKVSGKERTNINARLVLNLAGASVDEVGGRVQPAAFLSNKVIGVKGVYILARLPERFRGRGIAGMNSLGEPITCLPWDDLHYIGPTETLFEGRPEEVRPDKTDIAFLLAEIRRFMPGLAISYENIVMAWSGVRPITARSGYRKGKRLPFNVLHDLAGEGVPNMLALSWGIVVNHRSTARAISSAVVEKLGRPRKTTSMIIQTPRRADKQSSRLQDDHPTTVADVRYCVEYEHARDLAGVLFSRTGLAWTGLMTAEAVRTAALTMAPLLLWNEDRMECEIEAFLKRLRDHHRYELRGKCPAPDGAEPA